MRQITELDFSLIHNKVNKNMVTNNHDRPGHSFLHLMLDALFPRCEEDISSLITDGGNDRGADAVYIQEIDNTAQVNIIQSKYSNSIKGSRSNFPGVEIDKLISLLRDIIDKSEDTINHTNSMLKHKIQDVWNLVSQGKIIYFKVFLISNGLPLAHHERERFSSFCNQYDYINFEEINFSNVINLLITERRDKEVGTITTVDQQRYDRIDCDIRGVVANVDAESYIKMISTEDGENIKRHLFDENIRGFLGIDGGYNQQIFNSSISNENHLFWYLNNGITIIAKDFSYQKIRGAKLHIEDFQIVNGAQTSFSLFEAYKKHPEKISDVVLLIKVFASSRDDVSSQIAIATNSQARISSRDLKANDILQKRISTAFLDHGIFYERKRNQYENENINSKIDSLKLGQAILSYDLKQPHRSRTQSDEIFGSYYNTIFNNNLNIEYLIKLSKLYLFVSKDRQTDIDELRRYTHDTNSNEFAAYTQWHILYCISVLSSENGLKIPEEKDFEEYLQKAKEIISRIANKYKNQSYYRIFRSNKTIDLIHDELKIGQLNFGF